MLCISALFLGWSLGRPVKPQNCVQPRLKIVSATSQWGDSLLTTLGTLSYWLVLGGAGGPFFSVQSTKHWTLCHVNSPSLSPWWAAARTLLSLCRTHSNKYCPLHLQQTQFSRGCGRTSHDCSKKLPAPSGTQPLAQNPLPQADFGRDLFELQHRRPELNRCRPPQNDKQRDPELGVDWDWWRQGAGQEATHRNFPDPNSLRPHSGKGPTGAGQQ